MKKTMEINGVTFEVEKPILAANYAYQTLACEKWHPYSKRVNDIAGIYEAYKKPSVTKVSIYRKWLEWVAEGQKDVEEISIWVSSATAQFFTISGYAKISDKLYAISITAKHNRIAEII